MALEDAVTLGKALAQCEGDAAQAFALYEWVHSAHRAHSSGRPVKWGGFTTPQG